MVDERYSSLEASARLKSARESGLRRRRVELELAEAEVEGADVRDQRAQQDEGVAAQMASSLISHSPPPARRANLLLHQGSMAARYGGISAVTMRTARP